ncbi:MAG: hypothetical protein NVSMB51_20850 [Solirubrobacteraceae bacterium]
MTDTQAQLDRAFELAHKRLARRDHTVAQLRTRLRDGGVAEDVIGEVLSTLCEQRYLDDARFAERFVEDRRNLDRWGAVRIAEALVRSGIEAKLVARALGSDAGHDELAAALDVLRTRSRQPPCDERSRARALALLLRRGYDSELAYDAVRAFERSGAA